MNIYKNKVERKFVANNYESMVKKKIDGYLARNIKG